MLLKLKDQPIVITDFSSTIHFFFFTKLKLYLKFFSDCFIYYNTITYVTNKFLFNRRHNL